MMCATTTTSLPDIFLCWSKFLKRLYKRPVNERTFAFFMLPGIFLLLTAESAHAAEFDPVSSGLRMLWGLLIVLAIMLGLYYLLRRRLSSFQQQGKGHITIIETKHLMPKKSLMLVEVRGREYLVGLGADTISTIVPLQPGDAFASVLEQSREKLSP